MDTIFQLTWHLLMNAECFFFHGQTNLSFISDGAPLMTEAAFAFNEKGVVLIVRHAEVSSYAWRSGHPVHMFTCGRLSVRKHTVIITVWI